MEKFRYLPGVATLGYDPDACVGCGACETVCPQRVFALETGQANKRVRVVDRDGCMECGACVLNCPTQALRVTPGVGCAAYVISSWIKGKENASCC
jgi:NAD-dependent dihydropyrimidine dehydrogenase PreA subunit